jgi:hypothetical protein
MFIKQSLISSRRVGVEELQERISIGSMLVFYRQNCGAMIEDELSTVSLYDPSGVIITVTLA